MSKLINGYGNATLQIHGDSTGNETVEWVYQFAQLIGGLFPNIAIDYSTWNDTTQAYPAMTAIQAGVAPSPGIVFQDNFNRTASELYLSAPDIGPVWGRDGTNASGDWTIDGSKAVRTADTTAGNVLADGSTAGDIKLTVVGTISTVATGTAFTAQFTIKRLNSTNRIVLSITVSTTGTVTWGIVKVIGGTSTNIASTVTLTALASNTASQSFTLNLQVVGLTVTATMGASTLTGTLLQADADALAAATTSAVSCSASTSMTMDSYTMELIAATVPQKLTIYNCSVPGSNLSYQQPIIPAITPVAPDLAIISTGHNYSTNNAAAFATAIDSFLYDYLKLFPNTGVLITSQNPQKPPAANKILHYERQVSLRSYCAQRNIGYVPLFEKWNTQSGGGVSLVGPDGVHPTQGASSGSSFWADVVKTFLVNTVAPY